MDNEFWSDIWGGTDYDIYDDRQSVLNELYPPEPNSIQFDLTVFEDIPF